MKAMEEEFERALGNDTHGLRNLREKCMQLELDNRELTKHIKMLIET